MDLYARSRCSLLRPHCVQFTHLRALLYEAGHAGLCRRIQYASMAALDRHRRNGYSIESFVVNQRGSPVGIKKKIKKELIGTSDYPSNKIFTISNFITFTRLILTLVFLYLFVTDNNRVIAIVIYAVAASTDWMDGQIARMTKTQSCCSPAYLDWWSAESCPSGSAYSLLAATSIWASARLSCVIITVAPSMWSFPERLPRRCS